MNERKIKIIAIAMHLLMNVASGWMFGDGNATKAAWRLVVTLASLSVQWEGAHLLIGYGRRKFPHLSEVRRRVTFSAVFCVVYAVLVQLLTEFGIDTMIDDGPFLQNPFRPVVIFIQALLFALTTIGLFEAVYFYTHYSRAEVEKEALSRANLEIQLNSLKTQVQPHFLFNSLNTLQALVLSAENKKAVRFIGDLSQVYRYLLQSNDHPLIPLEQELAFVHAYVNLLKTRFEEGLHVQLDVNPAYRLHRLPPLTLQLLVENAVKHNVASASRPLRILIHSNGTESIAVRNNLQRKAPGRVPSDKKGLLNIATKYRLLNQPDVLIHETGTAFEVQVPLIKP
jgi:hypothetical protein